jgi:predicted O-linked N-acetylglucosamine transferase (SPINDLY family)
MLRTVAPEVNFTAPHCKRPTPRDPDAPIRVGFVTSFFHHHSVGNCYRGAMLALAQDSAFKVSFFNLSSIVDDKIKEIAASGIPIIALPKNLKSMQQVIAEQKMDILIYPEIGMDARTYYLAMARLAPHQVCLHGHPETTGIDTMDYFISSRSYEAETAENNYTERLLCNDGIDTVFKRPQAPDRWRTREELHLPNDRKLYVCPMAIQKFHPDYDDVLASILARDPNAVLVLFNDYQQQAASTELKERLLAKCDATRVIFLEWQTQENLFSIMKTADVLLDTIYFGAGTTMQYAAGFGVPMVTMPTSYARGRVAYSYYQIMRITNAPIASSVDEFVSLAVRIANDKTYHQELHEQIMANNHLLWESAPYGPKLAILLKDIAANRLDAYRRNLQHTIPDEQQAIA